MKLLSIFGFKQKNAIELAAEKHARTIKEAPSRFRSVLDADIEFLQHVIDALSLESAVYGVNSGPIELDGGPLPLRAVSAGSVDGSVNGSTQQDPDSSTDPQSQTIADSLEYGLKSVPAMMLYDESRLGTLLLAAANYQLWLKQRFKRKESDECYELMLYLSNRSNGELMSFPVHTSKLVREIRGADNRRMIMFYHSLLLNSLIELRKELL